MTSSTVLDYSFDQSPVTFLCEDDRRIYAFDLDSTLMFGDMVPDHVVKALRAIRYPIVIFSNQLGISKKKCTELQLRASIDTFALRTGLRPYVFMATADDKYRKPHVGMYQLFLRKYLAMHSRDVRAGPRCIRVTFCGDAAGRSGDFSDSDRKFAMNCGIDFVTPEVFFGMRERGDPLEKYVLSGYDPFMFTPTAPPLIVQRVCELVIMVGSPSSGKSSFAARHFAGYYRINQDTLKTRTKCLKEMARVAKYGTSIVVDNTNPSAAVRKLYIDIAKQFGYSCRCVYMNVDMALARHLGAFRVAQCGRSPERALPQVAYSAYTRGFEFPATKEGFDEVICAQFCPEPFTKKQLRAFSRRY